NRLAEIYSRPGAFTSSIGWYRAGSGTVASSLVETPPNPRERIAVDTRGLWPEHDPLFPPAWGGRLTGVFSPLAVRPAAGGGPCAPVEAADDLAAAIREVVA